MNRKIISLFLASALMLSACGSNPATESETVGTSGGEGSGVYYEITGVNPDETVLVLDGVEIPAELYCYWSAFNCSALEYQVKMFHDYFGMYDEIVQDDGTIDWSAQFPSSNMTMSQYAKEMTEDTVFFYASIENMAKKYGVELTEEDEKAIEEERKSMAESLGGEEAFDSYLKETGLSLENLQRVMATTSLLDGLVKLAGEEGSEIYLPKENYGDYMMYNDYIMLLKDTAAEGEEAEEQTDKKALAEDLLAQLKAVEDLPATFLKLAEENTEDTQRAEGQDGYFYAPSSMPESFEKAAAELAPGELSDVVETDSAYYIILGKSLEEGLEANPEQVSQLLQTYVVQLADEYQENMKVERKGDLTNLDLGDFYEQYLEKMNANAVDNAVQTLEGQTEGEAASQEAEEAPAAE